MSTRIYYFTGTGNSLWAARTLAEKLGDCELTPIVRALRDGDLTPGEDRIGIVFPIYMYRMPYIVADFASKLRTQAPVFCVATGGGDRGDLFVQVQRLLSERGLDLAQGLYVRMQGNYIPFGGAPEEEVVAEKLAKATERLDEIGDIIARDERVVQSDHSWFRAWIHPGMLYRLGYKYIAVTDKGFRVDESCDGCGLCEKICPVDNLELADGRPTWKNGCQQCLACLQFCPHEAIQVKEKTRGYRRYHHPTVTAKDIRNQKR